MQPVHFQRKRQPDKHHDFFYFNVADESHAKILDRTRKVDPMQMIGNLVEIDEY